MSEINLLLAEIQAMKRRIQALETVTEHPGFAASDVARLSVANTFAGVQTIPNTGLHLLDTNASHDLILAPGSNLTADRTLTLTTGDANRTLILTGDATLNQDVSTAGSPTFTGRTTIAGLKNTSFLRLLSTTNDTSWSVGDQIGALEFYSADGSNGGAGVVGKISVVNDVAASGNRVGMLFQTRGTASGVTVDALYIDEIGRVGIGTKDPLYSLFEMAAPALGTNAFFSFSVPDGTYNPRAFINHVTSTIGQYVQFDSAFSSGSGFADWIFSDGKVGIATTAPEGSLHVNGTADDQHLIVEAHSTQTSALVEYRNSAGAVMSGVRGNGGFIPASLTDAAAANNTIYYSTTASKLVYKDAGGVVNNLY